MKTVCTISFTATLLFCLPLFVQSVTVERTKVKSSLEIVWGAADQYGGKLGQVIEKKLVSRDMDGDGQLEKLAIATKIGTSQHGNTLKIFTENGQIVKDFSFSSAGGCAIGKILKNKRQQVVVWDYIQLEGESHTEPHCYRVSVYSWNKGKPVFVYYYKTLHKYQYGFKVIGPLTEYESNLSHSFYIPGLSRQTLDKASQKQILKKGLKWNPRRTKIFSAYKMGYWALVKRGEPSSDWNFEYELWEKLVGQDWECIAAGSTFDSAEVMWQDYGIPSAVWKKLWPH